MDDNIVNLEIDGKSSPAQRTAGYFILFLAVAAALAAIGARYTMKSGILDDAIFRVKYDVFGDVDGLRGFFALLGQSVRYSFPALIQAAALLVLSFSPLAIPACLVITGLRGFTAGAAISIAAGGEMYLQIGCYFAVTVVLAFMSAQFLSSRTEECKASFSSAMIKQIPLFLTASGACAAAEVILSLLI